MLPYTDKLFRPQASASSKQLKAINLSHNGNTHSSDTAAGLSFVKCRLYLL